MIEIPRGLVLPQQQLSLEMGRLVNQHIVILPASPKESRLPVRQNMAAVEAQMVKQSLRDPEEQPKFIEECKRTARWYRPYDSDYDAED